MNLHMDSGLWTFGSGVPAGPAAAVVEVAGAVLAWRVDAASGPADVTIAFTELDEAEWLWRVVGESGHLALLAAVHTSSSTATVLEVPGAQLSGEVLAPLRRIAIGHWLRRWWPASARDGIAALDAAVLDAEVALLTTGAEEFFTDDTFDSDVTSLLAPHRAALASLVREGDPRVGELATASLELADELGVAPAPASTVTREFAPGRRDDYALAAGADAGRVGDAIASGVGSVDWTAVPPGLFDAADDTIQWTIESTATSPTASVRVATTAAVTGIRVRLRSGAIGADGALGADGRATLPLNAEGRPITEDLAWRHDWTATSVAVGADVAADDDAATIRERVRGIARTRLSRPGADAYLAEILASESDY